MHIYEVSARNQYEATDELMTARKNHFDKVFLKKVIVKDAEIKLPREKVNVFEQKPPARMKTIFKRQMTGKWWITKEVNYMAKYLVQVSLPTIYFIEARSPKLAMDKAGRRFQNEHHTDLSPEFQWAELKGSPAEAEWVIDDWGDLPL
jgi:hypothetical protein